MARGERAAVVRHGGDQVQRRARVRAVAVRPARSEPARAGQVMTTRAAALMPAPLQLLCPKLVASQEALQTTNQLFKSVSAH